MDATELVCFATSLPKSEMNTAHQKIILVVCCIICEIEVQRMDRGSGIWRVREELWNETAQKPPEELLYGETSKDFN